MSPSGAHFPGVVIAGADGACMKARAAWGRSAWARARRAEECRGGCLVQSEAQLYKGYY